MSTTSTPTPRPVILKLAPSLLASLPNSPSSSRPASQPHSPSPSAVANMSNNDVDGDVSMPDADPTTTTTSISNHEETRSGSADGTPAPAPDSASAAASTNGNPGEAGGDSTAGTPAPAIDAAGEDQLDATAEAAGDGSKLNAKRSLTDGSTPRQRAKPGPKKRKLDDTPSRPSSATLPAPGAGPTSTPSLAPPTTNTTTNPSAPSAIAPPAAPSSVAGSTSAAHHPPHHKLGPKANTGAINAGLRALDRSGRPCRKWSRTSFKLKSFTGVVWEVQTWGAPAREGVSRGQEGVAEGLGAREGEVEGAGMAVPRRRRGGRRDRKRTSTAAKKEEKKEVEGGPATPANGPVESRAASSGVATPVGESRPPSRGREGEEEGGAEEDVSMPDVEPSEADHEGPTASSAASPVKGGQGQGAAEETMKPTLPSPVREEQEHEQEQEAQQEEEEEEASKPQDEAEADTTAAAAPTASKSTESSTLSSALPSSELRSQPHTHSHSASTASRIRRQSQSQSQGTGTGTGTPATNSPVVVAT